MAPPTRVLPKVLYTIYTLVLQLVMTEITASCVILGGLATRGEGAAVAA